MTASSEIWLAGGYGDVGLKTARYLNALQKRPVVLAGRDLEKARVAARKIGGRVRGARLDVMDEIAVAEVDAAAIVNYVEDAPHALAMGIMNRGGVFLDTSASSAYLERLEGALAGNENAGLAVLSVGLSPGLTNIMAAALKHVFPAADAIDICLEMGMGRHHGAAATVWFLENSGLPYPYMENGALRHVMPGALKQRFHFNGDRNGVPALGYGFSDQLAIARNTGFRSARTFVALNPSWATRALSGLMRVGAGKLVARNAETLARLMAGGPVFGSSGTRVFAEARNGANDVLGSIEIASGDQAEITALMTALTVIAALDLDEQGVVHSDAVLTLDPALEALSRYIPETAIARSMAGNGHE